MPTGPDSQSLTRLLVSAGVFLVVASFVVPGLILRDTGVLTISREELGGLTPTARAELERRQGIARDAGEAAPYVGLALLIFGSALVGVGIPRLRRQEQSDEERQKMELDKLRGELRPQSAAERTERLKEEAGEVDEGLPPSQTPSVGTWLQEAASMERAVLAQLTEVAPPLYDLKSQVALEGEGRRLLFDALLISEVEQLPDIIVEIKYSRGVGASSPQWIQTGEQQLLRYLDSYKRAAVGWLIVVVSEKLSQAERSRLEKQMDENDNALRLSIVSPGDLDQLRLPI